MEKSVLTSLLLLCVHPEMATNHSRCSGHCGEWLTLDEMVKNMFFRTVWLTAEMRGNKTNPTRM